MLSAGYALQGYSSNVYRQSMLPVFTCRSCAFYMNTVVRKWNKWSGKSFDNVLLGRHIF